MSGLEDISPPAMDTQEDGLNAGSMDAGSDSEYGDPMGYVFYR